MLALTISQMKVISLLERNYDSNLRLCSKAVKDKWRKFDSCGGGVSNFFYMVIKKF
jgi:hypothetical protein